MDTITATSRYPHEKNRVLDENFKASQNFYQSDKIMRTHFKQVVSVAGHNYMQDKLEWTGKEAAGKMNELSMQADKEGPQLVKRNFLGQNINEIKFHPAYWDLMKVAVKSEMFRVKWEPSLNKKFSNEKQ